MGKVVRTAAFVTLICLLVFAPAFSIKVNAAGYESWIQDSRAWQEFYSSSHGTPKGTPATEEEENFLIKALSSLIHYVGAKISAVDKSGDVDLSIDGIILGKVAQPGGVSYVSFDLTRGNVYGTTGAMIYVIFRGFAYCAMIIVFAWLLLRALMNGSPKARDELKDGCCAIVVNFSLIYLMPQIIDFTIFLRDVLLVKILSVMGSRTSITDALEACYQSNKSLITAIVYTAAVAAGLFYLKDYVSVAIQQTVLFGFFCAFTVMGVLKKKFLSDWCNMFFSNLLLPVVDLTCIMMPYQALRIFGGGGRKIEFAQALIILFMVWSARAARVSMMRLFGSVTGSPAGRGIAGLATMAQLARMAHRARTGRDDASFGKKSNSDRFEDWQDESASQKETAENMTRQGREITKGLSDLSDEEEFVRPNEAETEDFLMGQEDGEGLLMKEGETVPEGKELQGGCEGELEDAAFLREEESERNDAFAALESDEASTGKTDEDFGAPDGSFVTALNEKGDAQTKCADDVSQGALDDLPAMTEFDRRRYGNLKEMDDLRDSMEDIDSFARDKEAENGEISARISSLEDAEKVAIQNDGKEMERLRGEYEAIDGVIRENAEDEQRLKSLSDDTGEEASAIRDRMEQRTAEYVSGANAADEARLKGLSAQRDEVEDSLKSAGGGEREALLLKKGELEEDMRRTRRRIDERGSDLETQKERNLRDEREIRDHAIERSGSVREKTQELRCRVNENNGAVSEAHRKAGRMKAMLAKRERAEGRFAQASKEYGKDPSRYNSADDMRLALERRNERLEKARIAASKRGGLSRDMLRDLSPEGAAQVAAIQSETIRRSNLRRAVAGVAKTAAGIGIAAAGGAVGASIMAYGGEDASLTGAYLVGSGAKNVADTAGRAARSVWEERREIAEDARQAGAALADVAMVSLKRDKKIFTNGDGKTQKNERQKNPSPGPANAPSLRERFQNEAVDALGMRDAKDLAPEGKGVREALTREAMEALGARDENREE